MSILIMAGITPHSEAAVTRTRPDDVPALNLRELFDSEDEDVTYNPGSERTCPAGPPDSSSTLSWGTPLSVLPFQSGRCGAKKGVPDDLPPPSERHRMPDWKQHSQSVMAPDPPLGYTVKGASPPVPRLVVCADDGTEEDEEEVYLQQCYTSRPYTRKVEAEDVAMEKRKQAVVEQVMVDQLSRAVISDPDQNSSALEENPLTGFGSAPLRFRKRTLHETKVKTSSAMTEHLLSHKLRFGARVLSRNGRDASRELIGFFFTHDNTLTIYEYRQFGKNRMNALPFIPKALHQHQCGRRKGMQYGLHDFYVGASLSFSTSGQNLPESIRQRSRLWIRINDVDELTKSQLLRSIGDNNHGFSKEELDERNTLKVIQERVRKRLRKRAVRTLTGLGKHLRMADMHGDRSLGKDEAWRAVEEYRLGLSEKEFDDVWRFLDQDNEGRIDCREFIQGVVGEMNEFRKSFIRKAYMKLDPTKSGNVLTTVMQKFYSVKGHPKVISGEATEEELRAAFIETLQRSCNDTKTLSYSAFEDYYEGLSIEIPNDQDFASVLKNSWGL